MKIWNLFLPLCFVELFPATRWPTELLAVTAFELALFSPKFIFVGQSLLSSSGPSSWEYIFQSGVVVGMGMDRKDRDEWATRGQRY